MNPSRRKFFRGFGVLGAVAAGAAAVKVTVEEVKKPMEDISHLAPPSNATTISIVGSYTEQPKPEPQNGIYFMAVNQQPTHQVALTVGKDNRLWMKVGDEWKRVSIDV